VNARHNNPLADAFAATLARKHKAELVTGDPEFKAAEKEIRIQWLR
jgi:predicted nucleic acid-binding protein